MSTPTDSRKSSILTTRSAASPRAQHKVAFQLGDPSSEPDLTNGSSKEYGDISHPDSVVGHPCDVTSEQKRKMRTATTGDCAPEHRAEAVAENGDIPRDWKSEKSYEDDDLWAKQRALSLDGSGPQGLWQLYVLRELMRRIGEMEDKQGHESSVSSPFWQKHGQEYAERADFAWLKTKGEYYPCHYFDYIAGTSLGGLFAILLGRMHLSIGDAITKYRSIWHSLAAGSNQGSLLRRVIWQRSSRRKTNAAMFQDALKIIVSERLSSISGRDIVSAFTADPIMVKTLVLTVEVTKDKTSPYFFRSYPFRHEHASDSNMFPNPKLRNVEIWQVARATSAAPKFFSSLRIDEVKDSEFVDGALWSADPALEVYREIKTQHKKKDTALDILLSIGTGQMRNPASARLIAFKQHSAKAPIVDTLRECADKEEFKYFRFEDPYVPALRFDRWTKDGSGEKTQTQIEECVKEYCSLDETKRLLQDCAEKLVELRQARAKTDRWERFALGIYYTCDMCRKEDQLLRGAHRQRDQETTGDEPQSGGRLDGADLTASKAHGHRRTKSDFPGPPTQVQNALSSTADLNLQRVHSAGAKLHHQSPKKLVTSNTHRPDQEFNSSDSYVSHLVMEHDWPMPDYFWEEAINRKVLSAAHTKFR